MEIGTHSHTPTLSYALSRARASSLAISVILLGAIVLRAVPWLTNYPLHRDEALYGYWARLIASGQDPLLLAPWIDKPPLVLYLSAAAVRAFGVSELALRLPGVIAGLLTVWGVFGFARSAYGPRVAILAAGLLAVSPFAILFSPTAFTDPWLTLWLVAAAWAALGRRPFLAGLALGLAVASKQQGVLGVPLVFALLVVQRGRGAEEQRQHGFPARLRAAAPLLFRAMLGFALVFAPLTYWDSLRWVNRPSFWDRSLTTYGRLALAPLAEWPQRAADWAVQLGYLFGLPGLSALLLLLAAAVGAGGILALRPVQRKRLGKTPPAVGLNGSGTQGPSWQLVSEASRSSERRFASVMSLSRLSRQPAQRDKRAFLSRRVDVVLALYTAGYLVLHFVITFQPWDRYLLPILPWVCVLAARGLFLSWERLGGRSRLQRLLRTAGVLLLVPTLLYASWLGATGRLPVGSDHGAYAGLDQVVATLRKQPTDAVFYHRWLSWHYDLYLFDAPQERRWWGSGWKLAADAARTARTESGRPQWVVLPAWESSAAEELNLPLASRGLALVEIARIHRPDGSRSFTLYRIAPRSAAVTP